MNGRSNHRSGQDLNLHPLTDTRERVLDGDDAAVDHRVIVRYAVLDVPFAFAVTFAILVDETRFVAMAKLFDNSPPVTLMLGGTGATRGRVLEIVTTSPPDGAARVSVTVATTLPPPLTVFGSRSSALTPTVVVDPLLGSTVSGALIPAPCTEAKTSNEACPKIG